jgi:hypothetical protein
MHKKHRDHTWTEKHYMGTRETWEPLSARIRGLIEASRLAVDLVPLSTDAHGVMGDLSNHAGAILSDLQAFANGLGISEGPAREAIQRVDGKVGPMLRTPSTNRASRDIEVRTAIVILAALEGEITYVLRDRDETIRLRTDLAFEHLNRSIVVDENVRAKWTKAYDAHEVQCEKLGAVHLLAHGIWAFKVYGIGARTDLVYQEPIVNTSRIARTADGLVLTEWKRLLAKGDTAASFADARSQAESYSTGVLAGTELKRYRYAIVVSRKNIPIPEDIEIKGIVYRHINVAVDPDTPSQR